MFFHEKISVQSKKKRVHRPKKYLQRTNIDINELHNFNDFEMDQWYNEKYINLVEMDQWYNEKYINLVEMDQWYNEKYINLVEMDQWYNEKYILT